MGRIFETAYKANHTHTWWYNMSPLTREAGFLTWMDAIEGYKLFVDDNLPYFGGLT